MNKAGFNKSAGYWKTKDGRIIPIEELSDNHIDDILKMHLKTEHLWDVFPIMREKLSRVMAAKKEDYKIKAKAKAKVTLGSLKTGTKFYIKGEENKETFLHMKVGAIGELSKILNKDRCMNVVDIKDLNYIKSGTWCTVVNLASGYAILARADLPVYEHYLKDKFNAE